MCPKKSSSDSVRLLDHCGITVVEYCKPFKKSYGEGIGSHSLPVPKFEQNMQELHDTLITLRDSALVHSDLRQIDGQVVYGSGHEPFIVKNTLPQFLSPTEIKEIIEFVLDDLYEKSQNICLKRIPNQAIKECQPASWTINPLSGLVACYFLR